MNANRKGHETQGAGDDPSGGIATLIRKAHLGEPLNHEGLSIFPLFTPDGHKPAYEMLEDALDKEHAFISEASEGGSVPELTIENRGEKPILILEGDVLIGAKQNRVVNITVLVPARAKFALPVSCVERGRWHYMSRHFSVKRSAPPDLRRAKVQSVMASMKRTGRPTSDQMEVWDKVDACLEGVAASSPTASLEDGYATSQSRLSGYREKIRLPEGATGFLVMIAGRVVGMDLFGEMRTAARCWGRLSESYFLEALQQQFMSPDRQKSPDKTKYPVQPDSHIWLDDAIPSPPFELRDEGQSPPSPKSTNQPLASDNTFAPESVQKPNRTPADDRRRARAFLGRVSRHTHLSDHATGLGCEIAIETPRLAGMGLTYEGRLVHLAAFAL